MRLCKPEASKPLNQKRLASAVSDALFQERIAGCRSSVLWPGAAAMSKAPAQRPSAICLLIDGFELPAARGFSSWQSVQF